MKIEVAAWDNNAVQEKRDQEISVDGVKDYDFIKKKEIVDECYGDIPERPRKRICFPSNRLPRKEPLKLVVPEHRGRLRYLLGKFIGEQNWKEASGVLSMLLKAMDHGSPVEEQKKYWAIMEVLSQIQGNGINPLKIRSIYEIWMSKDGAKDKEKKRCLIQLQYVLYLVSQRKIEEAYNAIKFLLQDPESLRNPLVNMMAGLICYELWYSDLPKEIRLTNSDVHLQLEELAADAPVTFDVERRVFDYSYEYNSARTQQTQNLQRYGSDGSVGNEQHQPRDHSDNQCVPKPSSNGFCKREDAEMSEERVASESGDKDFLDFILPFPYGLSRRLLPIQLSQSTEDVDYCAYLCKEAEKDHYINAVKYLRIALYSSPPMLAALLPLIQLLLLGDQVEEALKELKKFSKSSTAVLPLRLRASLLECFSRSNPDRLCACYADILERDPTCSYSLAALISMYRNGSYGIQPLFEMIALHLDATFGACDIWEELASCLLKLQNERSLLEEDRMSKVIDTDLGEGSKPISSLCSEISHCFVKGQARKSWLLRCRWWTTRHFSKDMFESEIQSGAWQLLTVKAACAAHLYEPEFVYVKHAYESLAKNGDRERLSFLEKHLEASMRLYKSLHGSR